VFGGEIRKNLKKMSEKQLIDLSEKYCQTYIEATEKLTDNKVENDTKIFSDYTYQTIKKEILEILKETKKIQRLPVVNFAAGGIATPADAAIMMQLGSDGVFVGSGIFKSGNPKQRAKAIVEAVAHYNEPGVIAEISKNLGEAMVGINIDEIPAEQRLQERGW